MTTTEFKPVTITSAQLRAMLGVSKSTLYRLIKKGVFTPTKHIKRNRLFPYWQLESFLMDCKPNTTNSK
jgi:hypothetical protein